MTLSVQLSLPGNKVLTVKTPVSSANSEKPQVPKSRVHSGENPSGQENSPEFIGGKPCCLNEPERKTFLSKNSRTKFIRIFSKLYAGVYEIK